VDYYVASNVCVSERMKGERERAREREREREREIYGS
jgi:hypothetical protein